MKTTAATSALDGAIAKRPKVFAARPAFTLRTKAILALSAMVVYVAIFALYVLHDREKLQHIIQEQEYVYSRQQALIEVNVAITHSIVELQYLLSPGSQEDRETNVRLDLSVIENALPELQRRNPSLSDAIARFRRAAGETQVRWARERLPALRDAEQALNAQIEDLEDTLAKEHVSLAGRYREANRTIAVAWLASSILGVALFGSIVTLFFTRLAADVKKLEARAVAVVGGYRGPPLEVRRSDEVGGLMHAVNGMQSVLRDWERQQEISRQQRFHQEKMAAVGSLAAAVAHEVTNPIAAIAGIAQHLVDTTREPSTPTEAIWRSHAQMIVAHTGRIAGIMRQVGDVASHRSPKPELLDLNAHVLATCNFIGYDKRFRGIELSTSLTAGLPAVYVVADHLTQVLMNLLINAADAMERVEGRHPAIRVATRAAPDGVMLVVEDNGSGMAPEVLKQAFGEFFTTKPADKGRGIGLFLCRVLIEEIGGRIELASEAGRGTTATVLLPTNGVAS